MPEKTQKSTKVSAKQQRESDNLDRLQRLSRAATANATREGDIPFGAAVSRTQMHAVEQMLKGRDILKFLACTEAQLRRYSRNEVAYSSLPAKTQERLRQISAAEGYKKSWARKSATIAYTLLRERKTKSRSRKPAAPKAPTPESTDAE